jgi:hypothetical protein
VAHRSFVAFASSDPLLAETIHDACKAVRSNGAEFVSWNMNDVSCQPIGSTLFGWVEAADSLVADIRSRSTAGRNSPPRSHRGRRLHEGDYIKALEELGCQSWKTLAVS